jgi:hypothetical protein
MITHDGAQAKDQSLIEQAVAISVDREDLDRLAHAKTQQRDAIDLEVALHRRDSELHEGEARRDERRGRTGRAQTGRLEAAAAHGRIIDAEAERRCADQAP